MLHSKKIDGKPRTTKAVDWNTIFTMTDGTCSKLSSVAQEFRHLILADLQLIKFSNLSTLAVQNEFVRIPKLNVYVYQHREYMQAGHVKLSYIERACRKDIRETHIPVFYCNNEDVSHDDLLPFFFSNPDLTHVYPEPAKCSDQPRKSMLNSCISCTDYVESSGDYQSSNDKRFTKDHNLFCYTEDTWTMRLFIAVVSQFYNDHVDYTALLRGDSCNQAVLQRMPAKTPINTLLCYGSPDILIKHKPLSVDDEGGVGCIETKKNESISYNSTSMIPQQAGQLIGYIHQMITAE